MFTKVVDKFSSYRSRRTTLQCFDWFVVKLLGVLRALVCVALSQPDFHIKIGPFLSLVLMWRSNNVQTYSLLFLDTDPLTQVV